MFTIIVPYFLIGLCIAISIGVIFALFVKKEVNVDSKCQNYNQNNLYDKYNSTSNVYPNYFEISKQQGDKIQSFIEVALSSDITCKYNIINRIQLFHAQYWKKNNVYSTNLYDYILKTAGNRISTAKRDFVKRECTQVIQIITLLKNGTSNNDIVCTLLSSEKEQINNKIKAQRYETPTPKKYIKPEITTPAASQIIYELADLVPRIINGLAIQASRRNDDPVSETTTSSPANTSAKIDNLEKSRQNKSEEDLNTAIGVPYWEHMYVYSSNELRRASHLQRQFYHYFKMEFLNEHYLDIEENSNYAFILMYDLADDYKKHKDYALVKRQLDKLAENYPIVTQYINRTLLNVVSILNQENAENTLKSIDKSRGQLCQWIKSNEIIDIQGIKLTRGNFYVGKCFRLPDNVIRDNTYFGYKGTYIFGPVLNPDLPVGDSNSKNIFCSYNDMSPAWRHEYLMWLSGNVQASDVPVEILMFYLYGCEIRMFIDPQTKMSERKSILHDIISLYHSLNRNSTYNDRRVQQKLCDFIGNTIIKYFRETHEEFDINGILGDCSTYTNYYIAQKIANKRALSPEDAFDIAKEIYNITKLVPSIYTSVAQQYFMDNFMCLYQNLDLNFEIITKISSISYYYNYGFFNSEKVNLYYKIEALPNDLWNVHNAIRNCYWYVESKFRCFNQIKERYNGNETIAAIMALPDDIDVREHPKIQTLTVNIENKMLSENFLITPVDWLLTLWEYECKDDKSIHKIYADSIIRGLNRLGYGIVPNYDIDRKRFKIGDICVIYKNAEHYPLKSTIKYDRSDLFIKLASYIVLADKATDKDFVFVSQQLKSYNNTIGNHIHLTAVIRWRFMSKRPSIDKNIKSAIVSLTGEQQTKIGNALIQLACINGDINPKRIECLKKVLPLLGIESENIHSQIHRLLTDSDGFAVVEKKSDALEFTINGKPTYSQPSLPPNVIINPQKLRIFEQQTKAAQELLSNIFVEEDSTTSQNKETNDPTSSWLEILRMLLTKEVWERSEVERLCKEHRLMLGAVLEQINDFAYEKVDDAVIEDDGENIYVILDYKEQLI